jgi:uracil phosphoribosyltransferase
MKDKNLNLIDHPLLSHQLTCLRSYKTKPPEFREIMGEISRILAYEAIRDLKINKVEVQTPLEESNGFEVSENVVVVSILRSGNVMGESLLKLLPFASMGHIGIYRDKFIHNTVEYYFRLPPSVKGSRILLLDPLCATGDTAVASLDRLKDYEVGEISLLSILISEEARQKLQEKHPEVKIYALSRERALSSDGYLLPGIGDAGDRLYGTAETEQQK